MQMTESECNKHDAKNLKKYQFNKFRNSKDIASIFTRKNLVFHEPVPQRVSFIPIRIETKKEGPN